MIIDPISKQKLYVIEFALWDDLETCLKCDGFMWKDKKLSVLGIKKWLAKQKETESNMKYTAHQIMN